VVIVYRTKEKWLEALDCALESYNDDSAFLICDLTRVKIEGALLEELIERQKSNGWTVWAFEDYLKHYNSNYNRAIPAQTLVTSLGRLTLSYIS